MYSDGFEPLIRNKQENQEVEIPNETLMYLIALCPNFGYEVSIEKQKSVFFADVYTNPLGGIETQEVGSVLFRKNGLLLKIEENNDLMSRPLLPFFLQNIEEIGLLELICDFK